MSYYLRELTSQKGKRLPQLKEQPLSDTEIIVKEEIKKLQENIEEIEKLREKIKSES